MIRCSLREVQKCWYDGNSYYKNQAKNEPLVENPYILYGVCDDQGTWLGDQNYIDAYKNLEKVAYSTCIWINGVQIDLKEIKNYVIKLPKNITSIKTGSGVMVEISYQKQIIDYEIEKTIKEKNELNELLNSIKDSIQKENEDKDWDKENKDIQLYKTAYMNYIQILNEKLKEQEAVQGDIV